MRKKTSEEFITEAKKIHGDKYDYSKVVYEGNSKYIIIRCVKHDCFEDVIPSTHLKGVIKCVKCFIEEHGRKPSNIGKISNSEKKDTFIKKANKIYNNFYKYHFDDIGDYRTKLKIICPEHGSFEQRQNDHLNKKIGCWKCYDKDFFMKFDIVDNYDSITCRICGFNSKRLCGEHLSMHNITQQEYKEVFKDAPIICPEHIKYLSDSSMGSNNINHKSKTTEEERKSRSPFSKLFYTHDLMDEERISFINSIEREYTTTLEYYLNRGYSEEESKRMLAERQTTFSLEKCIHKHGEELGYKIWEERQSKWMKSLHTNGNLNGGFSNISQNLFVEICEVIGYEGVNFFRHNGEKIIGRYSIDFTRGNKVIEFNGDLYHGNPKFYESTDNPNPFNKEKTSQDIWDKDERKIKYLSDLGYKVLVVWESEYKNNSLSVLNKCLDFLKNDSII